MAFARAWFSSRIATWGLSYATLHAGAEGEVDLAGPSSPAVAIGDRYKDVAGR